MRTASKVFYWTLVVCSVLVGILVVLPFYAYRIPAEGAGALQEYDVKQYWPFGFTGLGAVVHDIAMTLALLGVLIVPATLVWSLVSGFINKEGRKAALILAACVTFIGLAYVVNLSPIIGWHLD